MPVRTLLLATLLCVALWGCGSGGSTQSATVAQQGGAASPEHAALVLLTPLRDATLPAQRHGKRVAVRLEVAGLASPGARIVVTGAGCRGLCTTAAVADRNGTWTTNVPLSLAAGTRAASVAAAYATAQPGDATARVTVGLRLPGRAPRERVPPRPARRARPTAPDTPATEGEGPPSSAAAPAPSSALAPVPTLGGGVRPLVLIGDSLSVGQQPLLEAALPGWSISSSARIGRPLVEGMQILRATELPRGSVLAIGLFTNDDPWQTGALASAVAESLQRAAASEGCAIWATIAAPPVQGRTYDAANQLLNGLAAREPRLRIVPWDLAVRQEPALLGPDRVHPGPAGAQLRAELYAQAARSCA